MALTNYTELQASIADWTHKTNLTTVIPDFIALAEARFAREITTINMETDASLVAVVGSKYVALPSDFNGAIALWNTYWQPRTELRYLDPVQMPSDTDTASTPQYFTIDNTNIAFDIEADIAYPLTFRYLKKFALSSGSPTNTLLTDHPDVYLAGSMVEAAKYILDDQMLGKWKALLDDAMREVKRSEARNKSLSTLSVDVGITKGRKSNIFRGY